MRVRNDSYLLLAVFSVLMLVLGLGLMVTHLEKYTQDINTFYTDIFPYVTSANQARENDFPQYLNSLKRQLEKYGFQDTGAYLWVRQSERALKDAESFERLSSDWNQKMYIARLATNQITGLENKYDWKTGYLFGTSIFLIQLSIMFMVVYIVLVQSQMNKPRTDLSMG